MIRLNGPSSIRAARRILKFVNSMEAITAPALCATVLPRATAQRRGVQTIVCANAVLHHAAPNPIGYSQRHFHPIDRCWRSPPFTSMSSNNLIP
jgi:hypothetical protein